MRTGLLCASERPADASKQACLRTSSTGPGFNAVRAFPWSPLFYTEHCMA